MPGFKDRTIILTGFSKTYSMTGWRLGYGVMRADLAAQFARLQTNSTSCTATFTQIAGVEAVRGDQSEPEKMRQEFQRRRDVFVKGLNQIKGFSCRLPKGAFYTFPNIKQTGWPSKKLADALLDEVGVAAIVGHGVRLVRRRLHALQHRQLDREFAGGAEPDRAVDEEEAVGFGRAALQRRVLSGARNQEGDAGGPILRRFVTRLKAGSTVALPLVRSG